MKDWDNSDYLAFTAQRGRFEEILLANRSMTEAIRKLGTGNRSRPRIIGLYRTILNRLKEGQTPEEVGDALRATEEFGFLMDQPEDSSPMFNLEGGSFTRDTKGAAYIGTALPTTAKCPTCGGLLHRNGMQTGHRRPKRNGGTGDLMNAHMQHPFCNSTVDN